jgi:hypothetical protein
MSDTDVSLDTSSTQTDPDATISTQHSISSIRGGVGNGFSKESQEGERERMKFLNERKCHADILCYKLKRCEGVGHRKFVAETTLQCRRQQKQETSRKEGESSEQRY